MQKTFGQLIEAMGGRIQGRVETGWSEGDRAGRQHHS